MVGNDNPRKEIMAVPLGNQVGLVECEKVKQ